MRSKRYKRHKLLLDEGLPPRKKYPDLNNLHNVRHIKHDFRKGGIEDPEVYKIAKSENRMVVVFNTKDFKPLIDASKPTVFSLSTSMTNKQVDLKLCKVLKNLKPHQKKGHLISISQRRILTKKH